MTPNARSPRTRAKKSIACNRCHSRKVKCDGQHPCSNCTSHGRPEECSYPNRNSRKVLIEESYIDGLVAEVKRLQAVSNSSGKIQEDQIQAAGDQAEQNEKPHSRINLWFEHQSNHDLPVYIGEAACTAFATRARQALSNTTDGGHLVRTQFISDDLLMRSSADSEITFPSGMQALMLVRIAQSTIGKLYYLFRWSTIETTIESIYNGPDRASNRTFCKTLLVFALGELYAPQARVTGSGSYPGLLYFREALHRMNLCPERCTLEDIEIYVMMVLYSLSLNRRNSAFYLIGTAVKLSIGLGLHHPISKAQMPSDSLRDHRNRLWWTVYILDRTLTSSLGHPVSIDDLHIDNNLPEVVEASGDLDDFDPVYYRALIGWSRIIGTVDDSVFDRSLTVDQVLQRAEQKVKEFERWYNELGEDLKLTDMENVERNSRNVAMLHLAYNQGIIVCTRASLYYMLRVRQQRRTLPAETSSPNLMRSLADRCRMVANDSIKLIVGLFVNGAVPIFDYFYSHYLFSASTIASIAAILDGPTSASTESVSSAETVLQSFSSAGNLGAKEFVRNIDAFREITSRSKPQGPLNQEAQTLMSDTSLQSPGIPIDATQGINSLMLMNNDQSTGAALFSDPWLEVMNLPDGSADVPWLYAWPDFSNGNPGI